MSPLSVTDRPSTDSCSRMPAMRNADGTGADQDPQEAAIPFRDGQLTLVSRSDAGQQLGQGRFNPRPNSRGWLAHRSLGGGGGLGPWLGRQVCSGQEGYEKGSSTKKHPPILAGVL